MDLYSVNYLHYGAPKSWYCVPPEHRERFEQCLQNMLPDLFRGCPEFLRHKVTAALGALSHHFAACAGVGLLAAGETTGLPRVKGHHRGVAGTSSATHSPHALTRRRRARAARLGRCPGRLPSRPPRSTD